MSATGPIVLIDDDEDDIEILQIALRDERISNTIVHFTNGNDAFSYLIHTDEAPFLILTDINMPRVGGLELRRLIEGDERARSKSIPFVFFTTSATSQAVKQAYHMSVQGFFIKPHSMTEISQTLRTIIEYWKLCIHPNSLI